MANRNRNRLEVPGAQSLMDQLKLEVASELGIPDYDKLDKGDIPARVHGKIGGLVVRKLIEYAQNSMVNDSNVLQAVQDQRGANEDDKEVVGNYMAMVEPSTENQIH